MYLSHATVPFDFLTILQFQCFDLLSEKEVNMLLGKGRN